MFVRSGHKPNLTDQRCQRLFYLWSSIQSVAACISCDADFLSYFTVSLNALLGVSCHIFTPERDFLSVEGGFLYGRFIRVGCGDSLKQVCLRFDRFFIIYRCPLGAA